MNGSGKTWVREARKAMGTRWEVVVPGEERARLRGAAEEALDEVERLEAQLSKFKYESEISGINARAAVEPVRVDPGSLRSSVRHSTFPERPKARLISRSGRFCASGAS